MLIELTCLFSVCNCSYSNKCLEGRGNVPQSIYRQFRYYEIKPGLSVFRILVSIYFIC